MSRWRRGRNRKRSLPRREVSNGTVLNCLGLRLERTVIRRERGRSRARSSRELWLCVQRYWSASLDSGAEVASEFMAVERVLDGDVHLIAGWLRVSRAA